MNNKEKELSIFVDESGMFGDFCAYTPYYIIGIILHDQSKNISEQENKLEDSLRLLGFRKKTYIHSGPIITNKMPFKNIDGSLRRKLLMKLFEFFRNTDTKYYIFAVDRKYVSNMDQVLSSLVEQINTFIDKNSKVFSEYKIVKIYYDRGQSEISKLLRDTFCERLKNASMKNQVSPREYRLLQVADLVCTLELVDFKMRKKTQTKSETSFFRGYKMMNKIYLKALRRKKFNGKFFIF